jgi:hypothetical protein
MVPVQGNIDVDIPVADLWDCFRHANWWPRWNRCFYWVRNQDLVAGQQLMWCFQPIRPQYLYKLPAVARIAALEPRRQVTWEVRAMPGFFARHTYHMEDLGGGASRFGSWEQATGPSFRAVRRFWLAHFTFVRDESLAGARRLEATYRQTGELSTATLPLPSSLPF